jgi:dipeptidyl aminopeptidase/acylaminoacyl peptidase
MRAADDTARRNPLIPRRAFFGAPRACDPVLSPDGNWLSWLAPLDGVMNVWAAPRNDPSAAQPLTRLRRPVEQHWFARTNAHVLFCTDRDGDENYNIWRVGLDDDEPCNLTPCEHVQAVLVGMHIDKPSLVGIALNERDPCWHDLYVIDILTGERRLVCENLEDISTFVLDARLELRLATSTFGLDGALAILAWDGSRFDEVMSVGADDALVTSPLHFNRNGDAWFLRSSVGRDKAALYRVDWATGAQRLVAASNEADIYDWLVDQRTGEIAAACVAFARSSWTIVDPGAGRDIARLESAFDASVEIVSQSDDDRLWVACAHRPDRPDSWRLFDRRSGRIELLFDARPELDGAKLSPMHDAVIKSRDGLDLVSYLTLPPTETACPPSRPLPMVVKVHGGPWARDSYAYNSEVQWLANRGYAVLQVNFRGSSGFGKSFALASESEWAGRMHDDLVDAVQWAIAQGIADREHVAIYGASYGGYAAFVGASFTPDLFCCSVSIAGIANLETMLENTPDYWTAFAELEYRSVGDPRTERGVALLKARSPINRVDAVTKPMLIGHGANDPRCKMSESDQIANALQRHGVPVVYVVYPDEGHEFARPENNLAFRAIMEAFLARHLGGRFEPVGADFESSSHEIRAGEALLQDLLVASAGDGRAA